MTRRELVLVVVAILVVHVLAVQAAKAGLIKVSPVGRLSLR